MDFFQQNYLKEFVDDPPLFITQQAWMYIELFKNSRKDMSKANIPPLLADVIQGSASLVWEYETYGIYQDIKLPDGLVKKSKAFLFDLFRLCYDDPHALDTTVMVTGSDLQRQTEYLMEVFEAVPIIRQAAIPYHERNLRVIHGDNLSLHVDPYSGEVLKAVPYRRQLNYLAMRLSNSRIIYPGAFRRGELSFTGSPLVMRLKDTDILYKEKPFHEHNLYDLTRETLAKTLDRL